MTLSDIPTSQLKGQKVLVRVDFNVPLTDGVVGDTTRITAAIPTITHLIDQGAKVILVSHLGRPKGKDPKFRMAPVSQKLSDLIGKPVKQSLSAVGAATELAINAMADGDILMLENIRFYSEESENSPKFSQQLAGMADLFIQDAFGTAHRAHASTVGVGQYLPSYAGFLLEKEMAVLEKVLKNPDHPVVAIVGGAKVSSKLSLLQNLIDFIDVLVVGGGMAFTFLKAQGYEIGQSLCEDDLVETAREFLATAKAKNKTIILPSDILAPKPGSDTETVLYDAHHIPADAKGMDVGPQTIEAIKPALASAKTIIWNGPLGVFERPQFAKATLEIAKVVADSSAFSFVGGGDSVAAIHKAGVGDKISHISTGGGASLAYLEGKSLPGISILKGS